MRKRPPLGTAVGSTTRTLAVPSPRPATLVTAFTVPPTKPATGALGRTSTVLRGRIVPPRGVREIVIAFSDGKKPKSSAPRS